MTDLLTAARSLGPTLAERSEAIEAARTLPDDECPIGIRDCN